MATVSEIKFELLPLADQETLLNKSGFSLSRREYNGLVVSLFVMENNFYEVYFYMRSHELVKIHLISEDLAYRQYKDLQIPLSRVA